MKILVVSDTHGQHKNLDTILEKEGKIDMFIHLGDVEGGEFYIDAVVECEKHIVKGNNDFFSDLPREEEFYIGSHKVFASHGHSYCVSLDTECIKQEGKSRGADIVMFGHTHKPFLEKYQEVTVLNPGSVSYPRQNGRRPSYIIIEMDKDENLKFEHRFLN